MDKRQNILERLEQDNLFFHPYPAHAFDAIQY